MDTSSPAHVVQAFRCGAHGIFSRAESSKSLAKCIHSVHQGQVWANSAELTYVIEALRESEPMRLVESAGEPVLSKREQDVVRWVAACPIGRSQAAWDLPSIPSRITCFGFSISLAFPAALRLCSMFFVFAKTKTGWLLLRAAPPRSAHPGQNY
jgi:hypothetical protein